MKLTMRTEYACRALVALSENSTTMSVRQVCDSAQLPYKFTEQIFRKLKKHSLVKSTKGKRGGYRLNKSPDNINLKEIINAVGESTMKISCFEKQDLEYCTGKPCGLSRLWVDIKNSVDEIFTAISLQDIKDRIKEYQWNASI